MKEFFEYLGTLDVLWNTLLRALLATVMGGIVGMERGKQGRAAGMRTHMLVCLGATLKLVSAPTEEIAQKMSENTQKRRATQPIEAFSAGSYFKRPEGDAAGRLIDVCGLKGFSIGGASVSEKHAGFVINSGNATFEDVISLEEHIVKAVREQTGVTLHREVEIVR